MSTLSIPDFREYKRPQDLVDAASYRAWLLQQAGPQNSLPWESDPLHMPLLATIDDDGMPQAEASDLLPRSAIVFGAPEDEGYSHVRNWVQVDDLDGMGALWCGSYGGKFFLRTDTPGTTTTSADITEASEEETLGMYPLKGCNAFPGMPRRACPLEQRDLLLKVAGKWRSDLKWDNLINGPLSYAPPDYSASISFTTPFQYFTLRLIQVGEYLCFHSQLSTYSATTGAHFYIGHTRFDARPWLNYGSGTIYLGYYFHGWTAEPPWGPNFSNSWQGEESVSGVIPAATPADVPGLPYCRVLPRITVGEGWITNYFGHYSAETVETSTHDILTSHWVGGSPDWMEDFLGIEHPPRWDGDNAGKELDNDALYVWRYACLPAVPPTRVLSAHLPHPSGTGRVYLALYTATVDNCLVTGCCCNPYDYA